MLPSPRPLSLLVGASISLIACGGGNAASTLAAAPGFAPKGETKCGVTKSQAKPLIVEWPSADRGELEAQAHNRGLVVVRYQGCEMQVLDRCTAPVKYGYSPITRKRDHVQMRDADDLYANIPVGAARFESKLQKSGELDVEMTLVGRWEAERSRVRLDELQGDCSGATHVVSALTVGAFTFTAGADAEIGGGATILGAGAGARSTSKRETLNADGDKSACEKATPDDKAPPAQCGGLIRVEVVPLGEAKALEPACPEGTKWDGSQCLGNKVVTEVQCPSGTTWNGSQCMGNIAPAAAAPASPPTPPPSGPSTASAAPALSGSAGFDRGAALVSLTAAAAVVKGCKKADGPTGSGHVTITFAPNGIVTTVQVDGSPFAGSSLEGCIAKAFRSARVPAFGGAPTRVGKSFTID